MFGRDIIIREMQKLYKYTDERERYLKAVSQGMFFELKVLNMSISKRNVVVETCSSVRAGLVQRRNNPTPTPIIKLLAKAIFTVLS